MKSGIFFNIPVCFKVTPPIHYTVATFHDDEEEKDE